MKNLSLLMLCLATMFFAVACDKGETETATTEVVAEAPAEAPAEEPAEAPAKVELAKIEVSEAGAKIDPPAQPEQLPAGAWYCDMGTTHWAAMNKPEDGKCPLCGMALKQHDPEKLAGQKEGAVEVKKDDHGHAHGEGEEDDHGHAH